MSKALIIGGFVGLAGLLATGDSAFASRCEQLERMLLQAQVSNNAARAAAARHRLVQQRCGAALYMPQAHKAPRAGSRRLVVLPQRTLTAPVLRQAEPRKRKTTVAATAERPAKRASRRERTSDEDRVGLSVASGKTYRTWCVRSCDGYYFPISFSTTQDHFATDQATCEQMCPGAPSELFVQPAKEQGRASMQSVAGQAYAALPTAFQYRTGIDPSCTCNAAGEGQAKAFLEAKITTGEPEGEKPPPVPAVRLQPGEDPETLADRAGEFTAGMRHSDLAAVQLAPGQPRQVLAGQEESTTLLSAVPSADPANDDLRRQIPLLLPRLMLGHLPTL